MEDETTGCEKQVSNDALEAIISKRTISQGSMIEVSQQVMGQIGEQNASFLACEATFSPGLKTQAAFIVAKLLDFGGTAIVIKGQKMAFGWQR